MKDFLLSPNIVMFDSLFLVPQLKISTVTKIYILFAKVPIKIIDQRIFLVKSSFMDLIS